MDTTAFPYAGDMNGPWTSWWISRFLFNVLVVVPGCISCLFWYSLLVFLPLTGLYLTLPELLFQILISFIVLYILGRLIRELALPDHLPKDSMPSKPRKVAVIGGGISGVVAAKELIEEGHEVVVFEANSEWGGVWKLGVGSGVLATTITSSSSTGTSLSDYYLPQYYKGQREPYHTKQDVFMEYFASYAKHYQIEKLIRCNSPVVSMKMDMGKWTLKVGTDNTGFTEHVVDYVVVCTGMAQNPIICNWPGMDKFKGKIIHSKYVQDPTSEDFKGKRVLVVGSGESASDLVDEVSKVTKKCYVSVRTPTLVFLRNTFGVPADYAETRSMHCQPSWLRYIYFKISLLNWWPWHFLYQRVYGKGDQQKLPKVTWIWKLLFGVFFRQLWRGKFTRCSQLLVTKADGLLYSLDEGRAELRDNVESFTDTMVKYCNGKHDEIDTVLLVTGFKEHFPFLPDYQNNCNWDRWLSMFHPGLENVAFVGFCRGQVGSLIIAYEMQCRWIALLVSEKRPSPWACKKTLKKKIAYDLLHNDGKFTNTGSFFLANYLARYHVNCEPNMTKIFLRRPKIWWYMMVHTLSGFQYRIRGPHAKPEFAYKALEHNRPIKVWGYYFIDVALILAALLFQVYSRIPLIGWIFEPVNNTYYSW